MQQAGMELHAPSRWQCIDFISDLHLQADEALTFQAWCDYLRHTTADAVFILGDLFEVWVGDDVLSAPDGFEAQCAHALRLATARMGIYIMQGNRDFLMGEHLMQACGSTALSDPTVLIFGDQRWLLTHGDALCLDDTAYMQFRAQVRSPGWQNDFLNKPLAQRLELARQMRSQSEARKHTNAVFADVDTTAALEVLHSTNAKHMIHGHTHRPATHLMDTGHERIVLSDWDLCASPPRSGILRLTQTTGVPGESVFVERLSLSAAGRVSPKQKD
jgi:UDP-2,3-diacylglucosamine hydrolase